MQMYYNQWKLDINYDKTKLLVVGERINIQRYVRIENYMIEILNEFKYLGFIFNKKRKFSSMQKHVVYQARKHFFGIYTKIRNLSIECQLKLFDNQVVPILIYGCEVWGVGDLSGFEKVLDFFRFFFNRSVTKCFAITNSFSPYHYHYLTKTTWFYNMFVYVMFVSPHIICEHKLSVTNKL